MSEGRHVAPDSSEGAMPVAAGREQVDKQNLDYVWRTGVAGGNRRVRGMLLFLFLLFLGSPF